MYKSTVVEAQSGIRLGSEKGWATAAPNCMDESHRHYTQQKGQEYML